MKIAAAIPCREVSKKRLEQTVGDCAEICFAPGSKLTEAMVENAEIIIGNPSIRIVKAAKNLRWLQTASAGVEYYTQSPEFPKQVTLTNATGAFGCIIAEYIVAGILAMYRRLFVYKKQQEQRLWQDAGSTLQLMGKHALILGAGDIGGETAKRLKAFGVHVTGIRRVVRAADPVFDRMATLYELDELLPQADLVIGCLPQTPETIHILDKKRLQRMKKDALLINVGRGSLIVTEDLTEILQKGHLAGAVLDVTEEEPLAPDHPLWEMEQVLLTPHISGRSFGHAEQVEDQIIDICCDNLERYMRGQKLRNTVDFASGYADYRNRGV